MFGQPLMRASGLVRNVRYFRGNAALRDIKPIETPTSAAPKAAATPDLERVLGAKMHRCSTFDKWLLVWTKKYPSKDKVPDKITVDVLHTAQSKARIRTANIMMLGTILGCIWAVMSGKREAKAGNTLTKQNIDWHNEINKEFKASLAQPKTT